MLVSHALINCTVTASSYGDMFFLAKETHWEEMIFTKKFKARIEEINEEKRIIQLYYLRPDKPDQASAFFNPNVDEAKESLGL